ncbi:MAG TPA: sulfite exporter TauE/SafE family protein [Gammaproteobacteria bacterium]|nr:sulfite exporter TauE/SafE family protein [Gammaproteobacteria bacterium]
MWAGFVRSGLGFGGAALGLPFMLFIYDRPVYWLPIIGTHLLFFSALTLRTRLHHVDWKYLKTSLLYILPPALIGILGLLNLPNLWVVTFIYGITLFYGFMWLLDKNISSGNSWVDKTLLIFGGYVAGTSLTGAPLMVAVYVRNVVQAQLRNTLFVLWFILVTMKMITFAALGVELHVLTAVVLLPVAAVGHFIGLRTHEMILRNDVRFRRVVGGMLVVVSGLALWKLY